MHGVVNEKPPLRALTMDSGRIRIGSGDMAPSSTCGQRALHRILGGNRSESQGRRVVGILLSFHSLNEVGFVIGLSSMVAFETNYHFFDRFL